MLQGMCWITIRRFVAAWIGTTICFVCVGGGLFLRLGSPHLLVGVIQRSVSAALLALAILLGFSAIISIGVMFSFYDVDRVRQVVPPRNYFWTGVCTALFLSFIAAAFAGISIDLSQLFSRFQNQGERP